MSKLKRAAQALWDEINRELGEPSSPLHQRPAADQQLYLDQAKAVIEAIRSPSMGMVDAIHDATETHLTPDGRPEPRMIWPTMIDALLKEK